MNVNKRRALNVQTKNFDSNPRDTNGGNQSPELHVK